ncbi:MAG: GTP-binding protein [Flavobacteriaceae bacterium]
MKTLPNDIVLRPRFEMELPFSQEVILETFENTVQKPFLIKRIDEHVFIKFNPQEHQFWSPQLHLEFYETKENECKLIGIFGPNPTLWTFFMFLHFGVATLFVILGVWAYSNAALEKPYGIQVGLMVLMVLIWIILYVFGRMGKHKGKPQMHALYDLVLQKLSIHLDARKDLRDE